MEQVISRGYGVAYIFVCGGGVPLLTIRSVMSMKMMITGDVHGRFEVLRDLIKKEKPRMVIVAGDFGFFPRVKGFSLDRMNDLDIPIYWCDGNHEDFLSLKEITPIYGSKPVSIKENIYYCPRGSTLSIGSQKILFAGGAFSIDKDIRTPMWDWFSCETLDESILSLKSNWEGITTVVSHTCPTFCKIEEQIFNLCPLPDPTRGVLDQVFDIAKPREWFFGHWHESYTVEYEACVFHGLSMIHHYYDMSYIVKDLS